MIPPATQGDNLLIGGIRALDLVKEFGSPLYVYAAAAITSRCQGLRAALQGLPCDLHYACKANTNIRLMSLIRSQGCLVDAVSRGEILACQKAGFQNKEISFTGNNVTIEDMAWIHDQGILMILDSVDQVRRLGELRPGAACGLRLNLCGAGHHEHVITGGEGSKFGIVTADLPMALEVAGRHQLRVVGVHQHIGSGILDADLWLEGFAHLLSTAETLDGLEWVDGGGGLGVAYAPEDRDPDLASWGRKLGELWKGFQSRKGRANVKLHFQPGRFLVADSGYLLMTVQSIKRTASTWFAGTDSGLNHNIRHPLYRSYHPIFNASGMTRATRFTAVCGNICESGDLFSHGRDIPQPRVGDILALGMAGAYGMSMASHYNSQRLPAEVLVQDGRPILIRRRECYDDLIATQEGLS